MAKKVTAKVLDMSKAETGKGGTFAGKIKRYPEGDYPAVIATVEDHESDSGNECWLFGIKVKSALLPYYCVLDAKNLWKVRNLFEASGLDVPKKKAKIDPTQLLGEKVAVTLEDDEYEDKIKSVVAAVFPIDELEDEEEEEEEKPRKKAKSKKRAVEDDDDDEEEEKPRKKKARPVEDEDDEEDEEEEEERPRKKGKKKAKKRDEDEDDEDMEDIDVDDV